MSGAPTGTLTLLGWREWATLPELKIKGIKAKIDSGAKTSALHAFELRPLQHQGRRYIHFKVHPRQRSLQPTITAIAPLVDYRPVRSSNGGEEKRPVIITPITLGNLTWPIEITLTNRDSMGFRLLLGRQALRKQFVIDPGHSFLLGAQTPN